MCLYISAAPRLFKLLLLDQSKIFLQACYVDIVHIFPTILCGLKLLVMLLIPNKPLKNFLQGQWHGWVKSLQTVTCNLQIVQNIVQSPDWCTVSRF